MVELEGRLLALGWVLELLHPGCSVSGYWDLPGVEDHLADLG